MRPARDAGIGASVVMNVIAFTFMTTNLTNLETQAKRATARACFRIVGGRRVRARGLREMAKITKPCRPGLLTGRFLKHALSGGKMTPDPTFRCHSLADWCTLNACSAFCSC